jgi:hypothetical protein
MVKELIKSIRNTEDSCWFKLRPTDKALQILNGIFDLGDYLLDENHNNIDSYKELIANGEISFFKDYTLDKKSPKFTCYFIMNKEHIHIILRKVRGHDKIAKKINKYFEFRDSITSSGKKIIRNRQK